MIQDTPKEFIIKTNHTYPPHNNMIFEEYFYNYMINNIEIDRIYIPILWTNFYLSRGNGSGNMQDIQKFLDNLDRSKKYFTVLQYDDGILQNLKDLDIQVFCAGGGGQKIVPDKNLGYPIPLLTKVSPNINLDQKRTILCSFVGAINGRHRIREKIRDLYSKNSNFFISESIGYPNFKNIMERSIFSLCPRGYGATSFRICESLQFGSIPVYVYDKPWIPWKDEFDFNDIGILIHEDDIKNIDSILRSKTEKDIKNYIEQGKIIYKEYFDYEGCSKKIIEKLNKMK